MGRRAKGAIPKATVHKTLKQERVRIDGRTIWLGPAGSERARDNYRVVIAEWAANGQRLPADFSLPPADQPAPPLVPKLEDLPPPTGHTTVADLLMVAFAEVGGGKSREELRKCSRWWRLRSAAAALEAYANLPAVQFGPRLLGEVTRRLSTEPMPRKRGGKTVTRTATAVREIVHEIRRLFRDAVAREELPAERLVALESLKKLPTQGARESDIREPVDPAVVDATCDHLPPVVADLVRFIMLTGCRPGEAEGLACDDIDTAGSTWVATPRKHKTKHLGKARSIAIGPRARAILKRWMSGKAGVEIVFSRDDLNRAKLPSTIRMRPLRKTGSVFESGDLRQRVKRAAKKAGVEHWSPYQLRHTGLQAVRSAGDRDAAQAQGGHSDGRITERYAKPDISRQQAVIERIG